MHPKPYTSPIRYGCSLISYCSSEGLVLLYMEKVGANLSEKQSSHSNLKEEGFRCILTLHSLLENPPGDFPENIREDVAKGFVGFFASMRYKACSF